MALPGFRPSVQLTEDPPRLTDKTSGRTLTISRGEARLLSLYDGVKTHDQLAQQAQAAGFHVDASHVAGLLERVAHAGFMSEPPPSALGESNELEQASDVVPALRPDLNIKKSEKSPGLLEVTDPTRGQTFSLYDFEVSIARMLNGKRTASQIIDAAAKIGIPVTLESLRKFVKQLRAYRFVLETPAAPVQKVGGTWSPRSAWKPEVRELFQSALRKYRAGKPVEATDYLVALLQIDPDNGEARDLQQRINQKLDAPPDVADDFTFDELHGGADAAPDFVEFKQASAGTMDITSAAPEHLPVSVTGAAPKTAPARSPSGSALASAAPARSTSESSLPPVSAPARSTSASSLPPASPPRGTSASSLPPVSAPRGTSESSLPPVSARGTSLNGLPPAPSARGSSQSSMPPVGPPRSFSPPAGSPTAWPVPAPTSSAPFRSDSQPETPLPSVADGLSPTGVRRTMFDKPGAELEPSAPEPGAQLGDPPTPSMVRRQAFESSGFNLDSPIPPTSPALPAHEMSPLLADAATPSDVRRRAFDKPSGELTDEPPPPDLGEPIDLGRRTVSSPSNPGFAPEPFHIQRTNTGEQQARPFDPPPLELDRPSDEAAENAASQAEAVWAPPARRTQPPRPSTAADEGPPKKRSLAVPIAAVVALLLLAGAAAFPVPAQQRAECQLLPTEGAQATAPGNVKIRKMFVQDGEAVEEGKPVAALDTSDADKKIKSADLREAALTAQLAAIDKKVKPAVRAKAEAVLAKAKKPLEKLDATKAKLEAQKAKLLAGDVKKAKTKKALAAVNKQLATVEKSRAKELKKVAAAQKTFDKATLDDKRKPLVEGLAEAKADREAALANAGAKEIPAPASGIWKPMPELSAGAVLESGAVVGAVLTSAKLELTSEVKATSATLIAGGVRKPVSLNGGSTQLPNADGALKPGACTLEFEGGKQPLYKRFLAKK